MEPSGKTRNNAAQVLSSSQTVPLILGIDSIVIAPTEESSTLLSASLLPRNFRMPCGARGGSFKNTGSRTFVDVELSICMVEGAHGTENRVHSDPVNGRIFSKTGTRNDTLLDLGLSRKRKTSFKTSFSLSGRMEEDERAKMREGSKDSEDLIPNFALWFPRSFLIAPKPRRERKRRQKTPRALG